MHVIRHRIARVVIGVVLLTSLGCGGGKPPVATTSEEATVTGTVTVRGQVVTKGDVVFDPSNHVRNVPARTAPVGTDGRYRITTLVGENIVRIAPAPDALPPVETRTQPDDAEDANRDSVEYELIAFDVRKGDNVLNIVLPRPN